MLNNLLPRIIVPFWCEKINNRPRLLFEETRYFVPHEAGIPRLNGYVGQTPEGLLTKSIQALDFRLLTELPEKIRQRQNWEDHAIILIHHISR